MWLSGWDERPAHALQHVGRRQSVAARQRPICAAATSSALLLLKLPSTRCSL